MTKLPTNPRHPTIVQAGQGDTLAVGPSKITPKLDAAATDGRLGMIEYDVAPRFVAPTVWHWHTKEAWTGYVLAGRLKVGFLHREVEIAAGGIIHVPPNCPFVWSNPSDEPARLLYVYTPGGFEQYFRDVGGVLAKNPGVPVKDLSPQLVPLWQHYGLESES